MIFTILDKIDEFISIGIRVVEQEFFEFFKLYIARLILVDSFMNCFNQTGLSLNIEIIEHLIGIVRCEIKEVILVTFIEKFPND